MKICWFKVFVEKENCQISKNTYTQAVTGHTNKLNSIVLRNISKIGLYYII